MASLLVEARGGRRGARPRGAAAHRGGRSGRGEEMACNRGDAASRLTRPPVATLCGRDRIRSQAETVFRPYCNKEEFGVGRRIARRIGLTTLLGHGLMATAICGATAIGASAACPGRVAVETGSSPSYTPAIVGPFSGGQNPIGVLGRGVWGGIALIASSGLPVGGGRGGSHGAGTGISNAVTGPTRVKSLSPTQDVVCVARMRPGLEEGSAIRAAGGVLRAVSS